MSESGEIVSSVYLVDKCRSLCFSELNLKIEPHTKQMTILKMIKKIYKNNQIQN